MTKLRVIKSRHSGPPLCASSVQECGEVSAAAAPDDDKGESARTGDDRKKKKKKIRPSDPLLRSDGGDVKSALHRSPGEDIVRPKQQRKKKNRPSDPVQGTDQIRHAFTGEGTVVPKRSSRPDSPPGKQAAGEASAAASRKSRSKRMVHKAQVMEDGNSLCSDGQVLIGQKKNGHGGSNAQGAGEASADARRGENTLMGDERQSKILDPSCFGDVNTNKAKGDEPANKIDPLRMGKDIKHIGGGQDFINKHECPLVVDNCLDVNLPIDQSSPPVSHSSGSLEEKAGEASFLEGTSAWTGEKRAKMITSPPTSRDDLDKTAQDDEHSHKVAQDVMAEHKEEQGAGDSLLDVDNDDEHSDKVAQDVMEEHKEEQGARHPLLNVDNDDEHSDKVAQDVIEEHKEEQGAGDPLLNVDGDDTLHYYKQLKDPFDDADFWAEYDDPQQLTEVYERLALYRIKAHELLWNGKELDIAQLKGNFPPDVLQDEGYFKHYENSFEWYFNPEYCKRSGLDDYQRLVLRDDGEYMSWEHYRSTCSTRKSDLEYVQFYEELSSKIKGSVEDYVGQDRENYFGTQRKRLAHRAFTEAPKIAARFCNISIDLVWSGIADCQWSIMFDISYHKDLDGVFFEIWKRITKQKMNFTDALMDVYKLDLYPIQRRFIEIELENRAIIRSVEIKNGYDTYVAHIDKKVPEHEARLLIKEAVKEIVPKQAIYVDYIRRKLEVAREIGVIPQTMHEPVSNYTCLHV